MSTTSDLKTRVEARKQELIKQLGTLKGNTETDAEVKREAIRQRLSELGRAVKEGVIDGWDNIGDVARKRISVWLDT